MAVIESGTAEIDITIRCGETFIADAAITDADDLAVDLTGYTIRATLRKAYNRNPALIELTQANGRVVETDLSAGLYRLTISATDTAAINSNKNLEDGVWDLEHEDPSGGVVRVMEGVAKIKSEATE